MKTGTRTKALLLCGAVFAACLALTARFLTASHKITVIGGADGPTAIYMANSELSLEDKRNSSNAQLQTRLEELLCQMESVDGARVTLFPKERAEVSLSVSPGVVFSGEQKDMVIRLVSGATGLAESKVTVSTVS